ncbi:MAG: cysteine-rich CWC family protein [Aureispira sp.]
MKRFCERCQAVFTCQPSNIAHCQCSQWQLSLETRALVAQEFQDCLCASCLQQLGAVAKKTSFAPINKPPERH